MKKEKEAMKSITFNVRMDMWDTLQKLHVKLESFDMSETLRKCINIAKEKHLDNYKEVAREKLRKSNNPKEKIRFELEVKEEREKAKRERENEKKQMICDALGGETKEVMPGVFTCTYYKYQQVGNSQNPELQAMPLTVPFDQLPDDAIEHQYHDYLGRKGLDVKNRLLALKEKQDGNI